MERNKYNIHHHSKSSHSSRSSYSPSRNHQRRDGSRSPSSSGSRKSRSSFNEHHYREKQNSADRDEKSSYSDGSRYYRKVSDDDNQRHKRSYKNMDERKSEEPKRARKSMNEFHVENVAVPETTNYNIDLPQNFRLMDKVLQMDIKSPVKNTNDDKIALLEQKLAKEKKLLMQKEEQRIAIEKKLADEKRASTDSKRIIKKSQHEEKQVLDKKKEMTYEKRSGTTGSLEHDKISNERSNDVAYSEKEDEFIISDEKKNLLEQKILNDKRAYLEKKIAEDKQTLLEKKSMLEKKLKANDLTVSLESQKKLIQQYQQSNAMLSHNLNAMLMLNQLNPLYNQQQIGSLTNSNVVQPLTFSLNNKNPDNIKPFQNKVSNKNVTQNTNVIPKPVLKAFTSVNSKNRKLDNLGSLNADELSLLRNLLSKAVSVTSSPDISTPSNKGSPSNFKLSCSPTKPLPFKSAQPATNKINLNLTANSNSSTLHTKRNLNNMNSQVQPVVVTSPVSSFRSVVATNSQKLKDFTNSTSKPVPFDDIKATRVTAVQRFSGKDTSVFANANYAPVTTSTTHLKESALNSLQTPKLFGKLSFSDYQKRRREGSGSLPSSPNIPVTSPISLKFASQSYNVQQLNKNNNKYPSSNIEDEYEAFMRSIEMSKQQDTRSDSDDKQQTLKNSFDKTEQLLKTNNTMNPLKVVNNKKKPAVSEILKLNPIKTKAEAKVLPAKKEQEFPINEAYKNIAKLKNKRPPNQPLKPFPADSKTIVKSITNENITIPLPIKASNILPISPANNVRNKLNLLSSAISPLPPKRRNEKSMKSNTKVIDVFKSSALDTFKTMKITPQSHDSKLETNSNAISANKQVLGDKRSHKSGDENISANGNQQLRKSVFDENLCNDSITLVKEKRSIVVTKEKREIAVEIIPKVETENSTGKIKRKKDRKNAEHRNKENCDDSVMSEPDIKPVVTTVIDESLIVQSSSGKNVTTISEINKLIVPDEKPVDLANDATEVIGKRKSKATLKKKAFLEELQKSKRQRKKSLSEISVVKGSKKNANTKLNAEGENVKNKIKNKRKKSRSEASLAAADVSVNIPKTKTYITDLSRQDEDNQQKVSAKKNLKNENEKLQPSATLTPATKEHKVFIETQTKNEIVATSLNVKHSKVVKKHSPSKKNPTNDGKSSVPTEDFTFDSMVKFVLNTPAMEKKYKCKTCEAGFWKEQELTKHSLIHKFKTYDCYKCDNKFTTMRALTKHLLIHNETPRIISSTRPHDCDRCGEKFETENQLLVHLQIHDMKELDHVCAFCSAKYHSLSDLYHHIQQRHPEGMQQVLRCSQCGTCFKTLGEFRTHLFRDHHMNNKEATLACRNKGVIPEEYRLYEEEKKKILESKKRAKGLLLRSGHTVKKKSKGAGKQAKLSNKNSGIRKAKEVIRKSKQVQRIIRKVSRSSDRIKDLSKKNEDLSTVPKVAASASLVTSELIVDSIHQLIDKKNLPGVSLVAGNPSAVESSTVCDKKLKLPVPPMNVKIDSDVITKESSDQSHSLLNPSAPASHTIIPSQPIVLKNNIYPLKEITQKKKLAVKHPSFKIKKKLHGKADTVLVKSTKHRMKIKPSTKNRVKMNFDSKNIKKKMVSAPQEIHPQLKAIESIIKINNTDFKSTKLPLSALDSIFERVQNINFSLPNNQLKLEKALPPSTISSAPVSYIVPQPQISDTAANSVDLTARKNYLFVDVEKLRREEEDKKVKLQFESAERTARMLIRNQRRSNDESPQKKKKAKKSYSLTSPPDEASTKIEPIKVKVHIKMSDYVTENTAILPSPVKTATEQGPPVKNVALDKPVSSHHKKASKNKRKNKFNPISKKEGEKQDGVNSVKRKRKKYYVYEDELIANQIRKDPPLLFDPSKLPNTYALVSAVNSVADSDVPIDTNSYLNNFQLNVNTDYDYSLKNEEVYLTEHELLSSLMTLADASLDVNTNDIYLSEFDKDVALTLNCIIDSVVAGHRTINDVNVFDSNRDKEPNISNVNDTNKEPNIVSEIDLFDDSIARATVDNKAPKDVSESRGFIESNAEIKVLKDLLNDLVCDVVEATSNQKHCSPNNIKYEKNILDEFCDIVFQRELSETHDSCAYQRDLSETRRLSYSAGVEDIINEMCSQVDLNVVTTDLNTSCDQPQNVLNEFCDLVCKKSMLTLPKDEIIVPNNKQDIPNPITLSWTDTDDQNNYSNQTMPCFNMDTKKNTCLIDKYKPVKEIVNCTIPVCNAESTKRVIPVIPIVDDIDVKHVVIDLLNRVCSNDNCSLTLVSSSDDKQVVNQETCVEKEDARIPVLETNIDDLNIIKGLLADLLSSIDERKHSGFENFSYTITNSRPKISKVIHLNTNDDCFDLNTSSATKMLLNSENFRKNTLTDEVLNINDVTIKIEPPDLNENDDVTIEYIQNNNISDCKDWFGCMDHDSQSQHVLKQYTCDKEVCIPSVERPWYQPSGYKNGILHRPSQIRPFKCMNCSKSFIKQSSYMKHECLSNTRNENVSDIKSRKAKRCRKCSVFFTLKKHLDIHNDAHDNDRFTCCFCKVNLPNKISYKTHLHNFHQVSEMVKCKVCTNFYMTKHSYIEHDCMKKIECKICGLSFSRKKTLKRHESFVHTRINQSNKCVICARNFMRSSYLRNHMKSHEGLLPFHCLYCGKLFRQQKTLYAHTKKCAGVS